LLLQPTNDKLSPDDFVEASVHIVRILLPVAFVVPFQ